MTETRTLSVSIAHPSTAVYDYLANPANFPVWSEFITAMRPDGDHWIATTPNGEVSITFCPRNALGVVDHVVRVNDQTTVHVPLRVLKNGAGSEVIFTVFRQPDMDDKAYEADLSLVRKDLANLKRILGVEAH